MMDFAAHGTERAGRLSDLRKELAAARLDGFFVPLADEYMNEYVPPSAQRLAWLTGFTGSAGMAIVLTSHAALFVDGRYTLQAAREADANHYELRHITKAPPSEYLKAHLKPGQRMGYDPSLHTKPWLEKIRVIVEEAGAKLAATSKNPVDAIWKNRPPAPKGAIFPHPIVYAGENSEAKRQRLARDLKERKLDAAVITSPPSIAWLLNVRGSDLESTPLPLSTAVLHATGMVDWFVAPEKLNAETRTAVGNDVVCLSPDLFIKQLRKLGATHKKIRIDATHIPVAVWDALKDSGAMVEEGQDPCELPRACKNAAEVNGMREAHIRDGRALTRFLCWIEKQKDIDEVRAQQKLLEFRKENKEFLYPSFHSISGAGANGAVVHYRATSETNRPLKNGELYLIDSGGQYADGTTDVTRTIAVGTPTHEMKKHFTLVLRGHIALARARFPAGTTGAQLDVLARQFLWREGLDYDHGTGHGVGAFLSVHEGPQGISSRSSVALQPGMIVSNEPGYYKEGAYGIRIENLVVVQESGLMLDGKPMQEFETLTQVPIDQRLVDSSMMDSEEKTWLDAYHAEVYSCHASYLSTEEKDWLQAATAPVK